MQPDTHLDRSITRISYHDFINFELIYFFQANLERCIPSVADGLKLSSRKILFTLFKCNKKVTVEQLASDVSKTCSYHHSQQSLAKTIVRMAQDYVGSPNNVNLLDPDGQFGSRISGGKDASNPKYIFTELSVMARVLFPNDDDVHLQYLKEDGKTIEPLW
ncbi:DNA topoisomerase 2 [Arabidopsis lyrata subsp. lyrata]|uniref:DNA topoisomerase 2 n=1 Tax=Arabidopsis lyrata subsp. lyrata TaxID=81972 RepID=UPI000A29B980|nr:DNA topoisomerase 2 [Arabidopsis lyrata subsp. lyrata]|eukprot:XP_020871526.1 DNA topoisomerase 2 [Arabidopsis lyrata subsp. lyrata]